MHRGLENGDQFRELVRREPIQVVDERLQIDYVVVCLRAKMVSGQLFSQSGAPSEHRLNTGVVWSGCYGRSHIWDQTSVIKVSAHDYLHACLSDLFAQAIEGRKVGAFCHLKHFDDFTNLLAAELHVQ